MNDIFSLTIQEGKGSPDLSSSDAFTVRLKIPAQVQDRGFVLFLEKIAREKQALFSFDEIYALEKIRRMKTINNFVSKERFLELFIHIDKKKIVKEAVPEILKYLARYPQDSVEDSLKELDLKPVTAVDVKNIAKEILEQPNMTFEKAYGTVMSKVRGKIDAQEVMKIVKSMK